MISVSICVPFLKFPARKRRNAWRTSAQSFNRETPSSSFQDMFTRPGLVAPKSTVVRTSSISRKIERIKSVTCLDAKSEKRWLLQVYDLHSSDSQSDGRNGERHGQVSVLSHDWSSFHSKKGKDKVEKLQPDFYKAWCDFLCKTDTNHSTSLSSRGQRLWVHDTTIINAVCLYDRRHSSWCVNSGHVKTEKEGKKDYL